MGADRDPHPDRPGARRTTRLDAGEGRKLTQHAPSLPTCSPPGRFAPSHRVADRNVVTRHGVTTRLGDGTRVLGQGRILEALSDEDTVLTGTLDRLGREFGLSEPDLRACLRALVRAGWIAIQTQPFGRLTVRLERRSREPEAVTMERRRGVPDAWRL